MSQQPNSYYDILGVMPTATPEEIKAAYKARISEFHPDRNDKTHAHIFAVLINEAYEILRDPVRRTKYDAEMGFGTSSTSSTDSPSGGHKTPPPAGKTAKSKAGVLLAIVVGVLLAIVVLDVAAAVLLAIYERQMQQAAKEQRAAQEAADAEAQRQTNEQWLRSFQESQKAFATWLPNHPELHSLRRGYGCNLREPLSTWQACDALTEAQQKAVNRLRVEEEQATKLARAACLKLNGQEFLDCMASAEGRR
jgi:curved DNA-binding protein CbpA